MGEDEASNRADETLEERIEGITGTLAVLINGAAPELRRDLRDLAIGILREDVPEVQQPMPAPTQASGTSFNPLGMAIPLFLVGGMLLFLFPPVGLVILLFAVVMMVWGVAAAVRFR